MYLKGHGRSHDQELLLQRENTKYEEVTSSKDQDDDVTASGSIFDDIVTPEPSARGPQNEANRREMEGAVERPAVCECKRTDASHSGHSTDSVQSTSDDCTNGEGDYEPCADVDGVSNDDDTSPEMTSPRVNSAGNMSTDNPKGKSISYVDTLV